jgi:hypothetical protein
VNGKLVADAIITCQLVPRTRKPKSEGDSGTDAGSTADGAA